jgi:hypothetical protein
MELGQHRRDHRNRSEIRNGSRTGVTERSDRVSASGQKLPRGSISGVSAFTPKAAAALADRRVR